MTLEEALYITDGFLKIKRSIPFYSPDPSEVEAIGYLYEYANTMRATPTTHDSQAEMKSWDEFFQDITKVTSD